MSEKNENVTGDDQARRNLATQRRDYSGIPFRKKDLSDDPIKQFSRWYADAENMANEYPNPMVLSTVDAQGQPHSRVVLLKSFDEKGFVFYTNYGSNKAQQIEQNSEVSLVFFWAPLDRQVIIRGTAVKHLTTEADTYFASRPRNSQIGAWASEQSQVVDSREDLQNTFDDLTKKFDGTNVSRPPNWGGYIVSPKFIEFWQGQPDRMHDRLRYSKLANGWDIQRLSP